MKNESNDKYCALDFFSTFAVYQKTSNRGANIERRE